MTSRLDDFVGRALMIAVFSFLTLMQVMTIVTMMMNPWSFDYWGLALISRVFSLIFLILVLYLTVTRLPPKDSIEGIEPRLSAIAGTFILMLLIVLPTGSVGPELRLFSTVLIVAGTLLSIFCLYRLGRSFSIMATARQLVTQGPYAIVRHPLYLAEAVTVVGILISNWSMAALLVGVVQFALQFRRMHNEERVLRRTFPEYDEYADLVPMLVPFSRLGFLHR